MFKNFENTYHKLCNYIIFFIIYFFLYNDFSIQDNFLIIIVFLYLKDLIYSNIFINDLFLKNYELLKSKKEFFCLVYRSSYILLFSFFVIIFFFQLFLDLFLLNNLLIYIFIFTIFNSIILLLTSKLLFRLNLFITIIFLITYLFFFKKLNIEIYLMIICICEFILITFLSEISFSQVKKLNIFSDMRFYFFLKKILVNILISEFYKIISIFIIIIFYLYNISIDLSVVLSLIVILEIGDLFSFYIKSKFWKILKKNSQLQKKSNDTFAKIINLTLIYFLIVATSVFVLAIFQENIKINFLILFVISFYLYNLEKIRNLIFFTREHLIIYKKHFILNFVSILIILILFVTFFLLSVPLMNNNFNIFLIYSIFIEVIYLKIIKRYILF
jgi:hypothetical protein